MGDTIAGLRYKIKELLEKNSHSEPQRTEWESLLADDYRPLLPQEVVVRSASLFRAQQLRRMLSAYNAMTSALPGIGIPQKKYHASIASALALIDADLPAHLCPLCRNRMPVPKCICRGRGWFSKAQKADFFRACLKNSRPMRDSSAIQATASVAKGLSSKISVSGNAAQRPSAAVAKLVSGIQKAGE